MSEAVVFSAPGGCVIVRYPAPGIAAAAVVDADRQHVIVTDERLPAGKAARMLFRDAWRWSGWPDAPVAVELEAARSIQRDRWRTARQPLLDALDRLKTRAEELGDTAGLAAIVARKAALRAVTTTDLNAAQDADAIAAVWPAVLTEPLP